MIALTAVLFLLALLSAALSAAPGRRGAVMWLLCMAATAGLVLLGLVWERDSRVIAALLLAVTAAALLKGGRGQE
jgi:hypothetical protein